MFSTPVSTGLKLLLSGGWGFFGGVCTLNELCGLPTSKASPLSPLFTGCPLARPKTKGYKLSQQRPRPMQHAGMQPTGQSRGLLERGLGGIRQGDGAEPCRAHPDPVPILTSIQITPKYSMRCRLQAAYGTFHPPRCPVCSGARCLLGKQKQRWGLGLSPLRGESEPGPSPRGAAASTDTSWLLFDISKPMGKAGWC